MPISSDLFLFCAMSAWFGLGAICYFLGGALYDLTHPEGSGKLGEVKDIP